ncbi:SprT-like domain-containing protein [Aureitalea sp. L0-47]|uniref:SprT-like domain-containing protein n=1 Tax=Aureitalea sp. L0-47 TaxID=2816962 RepID=UPI00223733AB|nr:SprT-like domain-containing protein [Aureitalea sp. L0-47]MCW5520170.1 SprT-like domain-containing protein [Aureitalea sp. L0-47]
MTELLQKYMPRAAVEPVFNLIKRYNVHLKIVNERVTRHGDYKRLANGAHRITVNANLNPYRFLITLVHEIAHLVAFEEYGRRIKPHGKEWKHIFQQMMLPFIRPEIFPSNLLPLLANHFKNPKASSDTDNKLSLALKQYDPPNDKNFIFEIPYGGTFRLYNGKLFKRGNKRVKRYECIDLSNGRIYLFNPNAEVEYIK